VILGLDSGHPKENSKRAACFWQTKTALVEDNGVDRTRLREVAQRPYDGTISGKDITKS